MVAATFALLTSDMEVEVGMAVLIETGGALCTRFRNPSSRF